MSKLVLSHIRHRNNKNFSVEIDRLEVGAGRIVCLLGPSGCGKSTTLRIAAGLEQPDAGEVWIKDEKMAGPDIFVGAEDRQVGLVFQDYALFPHLSVFDNIAFGLLGQSGPEKAEVVARILEQVGLTGSAEKYPHMLSGGEQQRVALARALAPNPRLLLMDEPFSGLDVVLRNKVRDETLAFLKETGTTVMLVTHDPEEAMRMADEIVLMRNGRVEQQGTPAELYSQPKNEFVAAFLGEVNRVEGMLTDTTLETELGVLDKPAEDGRTGAVNVLIRPEAIRLQRFAGERHPEGHREGRVVGSRNLGPFCLIDLELPSGRRVTARAASILQPQDGEVCSIHLDQRQVFAFD
ncbi:ABC transporter ATP-binding protein [Sneathiella chinensis]|uniref:Spermidine/putrescine ABC transporter ATPase n=1 Tax=Sneathiella chinensis TaxID=349750 RepID=A0ABQ5U5R2_9PROT|nr:ABC transporter ATP-binding protein [Sneathiella chinensis]GLQ07474.1 spermidine/putrescine ABC transporter ATPase [Sneathiella chinensis]